MAACQPLQGKELQPYDGFDPSVFGGPVLLPRQASSAPPAVRVAPPEMSSSSGSGRSATEARALKIHSEAERRRRERINAHLATLRRMIPDTRQVSGVILPLQWFTCVNHLARFLKHYLSNFRVFFFHIFTSVSSSCAILPPPIISVLDTAPSNVSPWE